MSRITINIGTEMETAINNAAKRDALSVSQWIKMKLHSAVILSFWPPGYTDLLGSIDDPTFKVPDEFKNAEQSPPCYSF